MIDHLIRFASEADAKADTVVGAYWHASDDQGGGSWDLSRVEPTVKVWQPASDTTSTVTGPSGQSIEVTAHAYLPYFYTMIGLPEVDQDLLAHPTCMAVIDWDQMRVIYTPMPVDMLLTYEVQPAFAGRDIQALRDAIAARSAG